MKNIRLLHLYLGTFLAPSLLFFAFTGAIQTLGLHEARRGKDYQPAAWIKMLAQVHKHQTMEVPERRVIPPNLPKPEAEKPKAEILRPMGKEGDMRRSSWPLKIFFVFVSLGLALITILGIYMSFMFNRNKKLVLALLVLGVIVPVALAFL